MNELITKCLDKKDTLLLSEFPKNMATDLEESIIIWISEYRQRHKVIPDISRVASEFPSFVPLRSEIDLPLSDIFGQTLDRKRKEFVQREIGAIQEELLTEKEVPIDKITGMLYKLTTSDASLARYSTFDRNLYFGDGLIKIGLPVIDRAMGGLGKGEMLAIIGRLGTGKTTMLQWIMTNFWRAEKKILCISNEALPMDIFSRIDGIIGKFNPLNLRTTPKQDVLPTLSVVQDIAKKGKGEIIIPTQRKITPSQVASLTQYLDVDIIVIDGAYLMKSDAGYGQRWERVADVSNSLKQIALDLQKPIIEVAQIKRTGEKDTYDPEDIAYSDAIGQDADFILAVHPSRATPQRIECQLIKNRYGPRAASVIYFDFSTMTIRDETVEGVKHGAHD